MGALSHIFSPGGHRRTKRDAILEVVGARLRDGDLVNHEVGGAGLARPCRSRARLPEATAAQPDFEPPSEDLQSYAGTFHDENLGEVTITWEKDHLAIDVPTLTSLGVDVDPTLQPVALDQFDLVLEGDPLRITFYDGPDGSPRRYGVNRLFVLSRD